MADLVGDDDQLVERVLAFGDVDKLRDAIERAEDARAEGRARFVVPDYQVRIGQGRGDDRRRAAVAFGRGQSLPVAGSRLTPDIDPGIHG